jgi:hypothetical protein
MPLPIRRQVPGLDEDALLEIAHLQCVWRTTRGAAHTLNNALTALYGLVGAPEDVGEMEEELDRCTRAARNLTAHHPSRFGRGEETELGAVVRRVAPLLADTLGSRFSVESDAPAEALHVPVDPARVELLLLTLVYQVTDRCEGNVRLRLAAGPGDKPDTAALEVDVYARGLDDHSAESLLNPQLVEGAGDAFALEAVLAVVAAAGGSLSTRSLPGGLRLRAAFPCEAD